MGWISQGLETTNSSVESEWEWQKDFQKTRSTCSCSPRQVSRYVNSIGDQFRFTL